ncbi:FadR/GntR family transcriptional regulator [Saccharothrix luteola]|uniref:FadR/GntR family transcriptional regulator n=1 Tax=Saccharothrix luteola TaxID=2893018 RepID=UPI001E2ED6F8|nr:FCD domain-containing protein [Saccharothrix luteola]MCC8242919.1 FCD domain-containing protein [Saccharothrix luteola]
MARYTGRGVHYQVVQDIGSRVVGGRYAPGDVLDLRALGEELDVSLTVLREALKVLTGKGLVDARQKRGTFVRPRSAWNLLDADVIDWRIDGGDADRVLRDLADLRSVIEPAVAHRAALRRTESDLDALDAALDAMTTAGDDATAAAEADAAFHRALLAATGNELFARMDLLLEPGLRARDRLVHAHVGADDPVPSHRAVLDAVRDGDAPRAELAMLDLLAKALEDIDAIAARAEHR